MYLLVRAAHRRAGQTSSMDELNMDDQDTDELNVCMFDDVCVYVPYLYMLDTDTGELDSDELDIGMLVFC